MRFTLDISGDKQFNRKIMRVRDNAMDMRPAFQEIHQDFRRIERKQFSSEGQYGSGGWRPLAASTLAAKRRQLGHNTKSGRVASLKILQRTLHMRNSLTGNTADTVIRMEPDELFMGSRDKKIKYHQRGYGVPQRRAVEIPERDRRNWIKILQRRLLEGVR